MKPELISTYDYMTNTGGESTHPKNMAALEIFIRGDLANTQWSFLIHFGHMDRFRNENAVGDVQMASNIDINASADRMIDLWYKHSIATTNLLFGIHDMSSDFNVTNSSLNFMNGSFGTNAEISISGPYGPPAYPFTSMCFMLHQKLPSNLTYRAGIYNGDLRMNDTSTTFNSGIGGKHGYFLIQEISQNRNDLTFKLGQWNHTAIVENHGRGISYGLYFLYEDSLTDSLTTFARLGWSNPNVATIQNSATIGASYKGLFQTRKNLDELGLGLAQIHFTKGYSNEKNVLSKELSLEAYYQLQISSAITLRPDTQLIHQPAGSKGLKDAWVWALRTIFQI